MAFNSTTLIIIKIIFTLTTILSLIGMGFISKSIFTVLDNTITITDYELIVGKIAMGFYWSLCIIALVLSVYTYGFKDL